MHNGWVGAMFGAWRIWQVAAGFLLACVVGGLVSLQHNYQRQGEWGLMWVWVAVSVGTGLAVYVGWLWLWASGTINRLLPGDHDRSITLERRHYPFLAVLGFIIAIGAFQGAVEGNLQIIGWTGIIGIGLLIQAARSPAVGNLGTSKMADAAKLQQQAKGQAGAAGGDPSMSIGTVKGKPFLWSTDRHVFILAATRSGKGVSLLIPNLLTYPGSVFVLDPKGENARATARQRRAFGHVAVLDPFGATQSPSPRPDLAGEAVGFNPLASLQGEAMITDGATLAAALVVGPDDHWHLGAAQLLKGVILHTVTAPAPELPGPRDLVTVRRLLMRDFFPVLDENGQGAGQSTLERMQANSGAEGVVGDVAGWLLATPADERGSILSTAINQTQFIDDPAMRRSLAADAPQLDPGEFRRGVLSAYLCLPAPRFPAFSRWLRLVLNAALSEMTARHDPPALPVRFMLDELATLGRLEAVENASGLAAGYGVQLWTVWQDLGQLKDIYKARWPTFINNAGVRVMFSANDLETAEYVSKMLGVGTVLVGASDQSLSVTRRELRTPDEIMRLPDNEMLVLIAGKAPTITERLPYWQRTDLKGLWDDPRRA